MTLNPEPDLEYNGEHLSINICFPKNLNRKYLNAESVPDHCLNLHKHTGHSVQLATANINASHMLSVLPAPASLRGWSPRLTGLIRKSLPCNMLREEWGESNGGGRGIIGETENTEAHYLHSSRSNQYNWWRRNCCPLSIQQAKGLDARANVTVWTECYAWVHTCLYVCIHMHVLVQVVTGRWRSYCRENVIHNNFLFWFYDEVPKHWVTVNPDNTINNLLESKPRESDAWLIEPYCMRRRKRSFASTIYNSERTISPTQRLWL